MLMPEVQRCAARSPLCWLASVDEAGQPNVSPKEVYAVVDAQHLVIANIASPTSVRNVEQHAQVCVSFVDILVQKGFKITGLARNLRPDDPEFARWVQPLAGLAGPRFPIHSVILIRATGVQPIVAPSYRLYPQETTEAGQIQAALRTYGVQLRAENGG